MNNIFTALGGMFLALALFYLLGLPNRFARRFYPGRPGVLVRAAAPLIFAGLAVACFAGAALPTLLVATIAGGILIVHNRRRKISV